MIQCDVPIEITNEKVFNYLVEHYSDSVAYRSEGGKNFIKLMMPGMARIIQKIIDNNVASHFQWRLLNRQTSKPNI